ncbi:transglutaminase family protein [Luteolibacter ambystomatis]|uniref:Transglutaminase family protein n=1 Tax=Luteolibacter ambystomatis TaxID=2824561 RepID=A0A975J201_9BACT|nr:transglutaminase family protein [Luteolibacter ambystomatis]QUE52563.1 transglutaminase family protein [Luteolibacter ambystomatis]
MSIHVALHHRTSYQYDRWVGHGPHVIRLKPAPHCRTRVLSYSLKVGPCEVFTNWQQDPQSNHLARIVFPDKTDRLDIEVNLVVEMAVSNPFDFFLEPAAEKIPFTYDQSLNHELAPFLLLEKPGVRLAARIERYRGPARPTMDLLVEINRDLQQDIAYTIRMEPGVQAPEETLTKRSGSCRDSAWLLVQMLRHLGLAARFVSGYLIQLKPDPDPRALVPDGAEQDFTDLHAWTEVYLPGAGWIGLDPTSGLLAGEGHLPLACSPDPSSAAPVTGALDKCESEMEHVMEVRRVYETPRTTMPYTDAQWQDILRLGKDVDRDLKDMDVRLTMGGEPTFVSMDDPEGGEWNTAALGETKRLLSGDLIKRLRKRFAPGGVLFYGQGKWYPGESLPRWALACYWRKDGVPAWEDDRLIADERIDYGHSSKEAKHFGNALAGALGVNPKHLIPAREDVFHLLLRERRLPVNVDPLESNLDDPEERARLARIFSQGPATVVGYALPLQRARDNRLPRWRSGPWFLRDETLYLLPGDSPMGYRLPLDSLPWVSEEDYPWIRHRDPMEPLGPLPRRERVMQVPGVPPEEKEPKRPAMQESASDTIRTAICFEARNGRLHLFLPPLEHVEDFLKLVEVIEQTAASLNMPVVLEGTPPPFDPRIQNFKVTPDPGVIEVNLHPAASWEELVSNSEILHEEARLTRLVPEKFMQDGRHSGTGGGHHIILGGDTPADSPILRRPDLLRSFLTYWNHHPSLSYLFSGLFVGPTSQAPRTDEARHDLVHELEIAFGTLKSQDTPPPWLVDRVFRNLLTDLTGNTHRTEFCIDKLFSPDSSSGRLGLLEMRAFEMPPHHQMSMAQQLVLRALTARFWKHPYEKPLVRWGSTLHDRWMLPHFVEADFNDVIADLNREGYPVDREWFKPQVEFRFPKVGDFVAGGVEIELRSAIEPWHVLGEEGTAGGTARHVDSSLERLQVKARGLTGERHRLACNGWTIPLHPTGTRGEFVAGIRYRAWQPPHCLHPTIRVHTPLVFDLIDGWNDLSLGGCTFHVAHPGGRNYNTFPVNAYEAEARRKARFFREGHTGGRIRLQQIPSSPDFPFTLDLRMIPADP